MENWKAHRDCRLHPWQVLPWLQWSKPTPSSGSALKLGACDEAGCCNQPKKGAEGSGKLERNCGGIQAVNGRVPQADVSNAAPGERRAAPLKPHGKCLLKGEERVCRWGSSACPRQGEESKLLRDR